MIRTVVHFVDSDTFGGSEQSLLHLLHGLDPARWRPVLLHHPAPGLARLVDGAAALGVAVREVPRMSDADFAWRIPAFLRSLGSEQPAVFHAHLSWPLACKFGLIAARVRRVPAIVATAQLFVEALVNRSVRWQQRLVSAGVHRYFAVSRDVAGRLASSFGIPAAKLRVVYNGIDPGPFDAPVSPVLRAELTGGTSRAVVLTSARLAAQKGLDTLLAAAALVPDAVFVIAGDGPDRAVLETRARGLGIAERVRFLGPRPDVPQLLAVADLFVLPSLFEGLPLAVLEAMAAAKPVVASRIGGTDEAVVESVTGLLVPPSDPGALAGAIRTVLADPQLALRLGAAGRARVIETFSAERMVQAVEASYGELLAPGARG